MRRSRWVTLAALGLLHVLNASAEEAPDYASETLSGSWGGLREEAYRRGITLEAVLKLDWLRTGGGVQAGQDTASNLDLKLMADLDALYGWGGATAYLHVLDNRGGKPNARLAGSLMGLSNIETTDATAKIFQAWLQTNYFDDRLSVLVGLYPIDSEFSVLDSAGLFLHPSFGASADLALTRGPSIFNTSAFGTRLKWLSADRALYAQGAWLDGIPGDPANPYGTHIRFDKGDGSFWIAEFGYTPEEVDHVSAPVSPQNGGPQEPAAVADEKYETFAKYALGFWRYTSKVDDLVNVDAVGNPLQRRSLGWYALAEKTVYRSSANPAANLSLFARYSATDGDSTEIRSALNLGARFRGLIAGRDDDIAGLGYTRAYLGNKYRQTQQLAGIDTRPAEEAIELTYRLQWSKWLALQPLWQRVRCPGGDASQPDVSFIGMRLEITL